MSKKWSEVFWEYTLSFLLISMFSLANNYSYQNTWQMQINQIQVYIELANSPSPRSLWQGQWATKRSEVFWEYKAVQLENFLKIGPSLVVTWQYLVIHNFTSLTLNSNKWNMYWNPVLLFNSIIIWQKGISFLTRKSGTRRSSVLFYFSKIISFSSKSLIWLLDFRFHAVGTRGVCLFVSL